MTVRIDQARQDPKNANKPQQVLDKIVEGLLNKFYQEVVLMEQPFVKDQNITVAQLVTTMVGKTGENVKVRRFVRFQMGEE